MKKIKILMILHRTPPIHGAGKVGDFIGSSQKLNREFNCKFITIKSSSTINDIGKVDIKKIYLLIELYIKVALSLILFRPDKIYFTSSIRSVALYRDLLISTLFKGYKLFKKTDIYYHYHTKGVNQFVSTTPRNLKLTNFFLKDINLILLSPPLSYDFKKITTYKKILYLPNGVEDNYVANQFENYISKKKFNKINILYLSNMIKAKGYFEVLKLAKYKRDRDIHFHFAGAWQNAQDEIDFFDYIKKNSLEKNVTFHGFINGKEKRELFERSHLFIFPTLYINEAFPLSILEALSYGLPTISTDEGSIPYIIDNKSGIICSNLNNLPKALDEGLDRLINIETAIYCRERYLDNFSLKRFENSLIEILS